MRAVLFSLLNDKTEPLRICGWSISFAQAQGTVDAEPLLVRSKITEGRRTSVLDETLIHPLQGYVIRYPKGTGPVAGKDARFLLETTMSAPTDVRAQVYTSIRKTRTRKGPRGVSSTTARARKKRRGRKDSAR